MAHNDHTTARRKDWLEHDWLIMSTNTIFTKNSLAKGNCGIRKKIGKTLHFNQRAFFFLNDQYGIECVVFPRVFQCLIGSVSQSIYYTEDRYVSTTTETY